MTEEARLQRDGLALTLPCPPTANLYYRHVGHRTLLSKEGRVYKQTVADRCLLARVRKLSGEVAVAVHWYRPAKRGDVDNILKPLLDALKGHAFGDDARVAKLCVERHDTDRHHPRVEVTISPLAPPRPTP